MALLRLLIVITLAAAIGYGGYWLGRNYGLWGTGAEKFILGDFHSLVVVPSGQDDCGAAVGYQEKHVIGSFVAEPVRRLVCREYYFQERPEARFEGAPIVLVRLENGEHHWVLESQLTTPLRN